MRLPVPLAGNHGIARSSLESNQITINLYPEITKDGKNPVPLYRIEGMSTSVILGTGICRSQGALFLDKLFFVSGSKLYSIDINETVVEIGTLNTTSGRVSIVEGQTYLMLVDGSNGYTYDGTTFAAITDVNFPTEQTPALIVDHVTYKDGFFVVVQKSSGNYYVSALENPTSWDGLDFENAEGRPDDAVLPLATDDFLYLFGEYSTEAHYNYSGQQFPFKRAQGGVSSWGIHAEWSAAEGDNAIFFLGQIREGGIQIAKTMGSRVEVISTPEIADEIDGLTITSDAFGFCYMQNSHHFYVLTFPSAMKTFVFDITTGLWHTRSSKDIERWRPNGHGFFNGKHYVGSHEDGQFYTLELGTYTDNSEYIECQRTTAPIHKDYSALTFHELTLDLQGGVGTNASFLYASVATSQGDGLTYIDDTTSDFHAAGVKIGDIFTDPSGAGLDEGPQSRAITTVSRTRIDFETLFPGTVFNDAPTDYTITGDRTIDPVIMMRYSDDGGKTWSNELQASIGKIGNYKFKASWEQLGDSYERIFEFRTTDSFFTAWLGCYARVTQSAF